VCITFFFVRNVFYFVVVFSIVFIVIEGYLIGGCLKEGRFG